MLCGSQGMYKPTYISRLLTFIQICFRFLITVIATIVYNTCTYVKLETICEIYKTNLIDEHVSTHCSVSYIFSSQCFSVLYVFCLFLSKTRPISLVDQYIYTNTLLYERYLRCFTSKRPGMLYLYGNVIT